MSTTTSTTPSYMKELISRTRAMAAQIHLRSPRTLARQQASLRQELQDLFPSCGNPDCTRANIINDGPSKICTSCGYVVSIDEIDSASTHADDFHVEVSRYMAGLTVFHPTGVEQWRTSLRLKKQLRRVEGDIRRWDEVEDIIRRQMDEEAAVRSGNV